MCSHELHFACIFKGFKDYLPPGPNPEAQVKKLCLQCSGCLCTSTLSGAPKGNSTCILNTGFGAFIKAPPLCFRQINKLPVAGEALLYPCLLTSSPVLSKAPRNLSPREDGVRHSIHLAFSREPTQNK